MIDLENPTIIATFRNTYGIPVGNTLVVHEEWWLLMLEILVWSHIRKS